MNEQIIGGDVPKPKITLADTSKISCAGCGGSVFNSGMLLRKASKILTGAAEDQIVPLQVAYCVKCGAALDEMIPAELK